MKNIIFILIFFILSINSTLAYERKYEMYLDQPRWENDSVFIIKVKLINNSDNTIIIDNPDFYYIKSSKEIFSGFLLGGIF